LLGHGPDREKTTRRTENEKNNHDGETEDNERERPNDLQSNEDNNRRPKQCPSSGMSAHNTEIRGGSDGVRPFSGMSAHNTKIRVGIDEERPKNNGNNNGNLNASLNDGQFDGHAFLQHYQRGGGGNQLSWDHQNTTNRVPDFGQHANGHSLR